MSENVIRCGLIQAANVIAPREDSHLLSRAEQRDEAFKIRDAMIEKHLGLLKDAADQGAEVVCLQELFMAPYFCVEQNPRWYDLAERVPDGPTTRLMRETARRLGIALVVPLYEEVITGVYYNTAVVIDAQGEVLGIYRKNHLPHLPGFWEKFYFKHGNLGYPTFDLGKARIGVYLCYDRHFPEGARLLGMAGADIVFNPSATIDGLSRYLWELEQPAHAVANGYFVGAINRVGHEAPWNSGKYYGSSYFCDPRGRILAQASEVEDQVLVADLDLSMVREVRNTWQFYRDRRPETYGDLTRLLP